LWFECEGKIKLISKGADSTMFERLSDCDENKNLKEQTEIHLKEFGELVLVLFLNIFSLNH
jgi:magnesium-transporting ATPase (P-type)